MERRDAVLDYWFGADRTKPVANFSLWFDGTAEIDAEIRTRFANDVEKAMRGEYNSWMADPHGILALIVLLDQFPLNIYRDTPLSFNTSASAIPIAYTAVGRGFDARLPSLMRMFIYLPLEHSELLVDQDRCVELHQQAGLEMQWAVEHRDIIAKYGRFPGRNAVMGRESTPAELKYLAEGGVF